MAPMRTDFEFFINLGRISRNVIKFNIVQFKGIASDYFEFVCDCVCWLVLLIRRIDDRYTR